jgi:DNA-binding response OmpR family regulator
VTCEGAPPPSRRGAVFVAEHEPEVAEMTRRYLERAAIPVRATATAGETLAMLGDPSAALFVVDLTMPGLDVRRVRRALASGTPVPVVFLVDSHGVRPRGLSGAVARERRWISRPFSPRTLVTAVTELLHPAPPSSLAPPAPVPLPTSMPPLGSVPPPTPLPPEQPTPSPAVPAPSLATAGNSLTLDAAHRTAIIAGHAIPLTRTEFALIAALASRAGRVLSRADLLAALEGTRGKSPGARAVDVYITQLRAKLPGVTIRTVRSIGYVLETARFS